MDYLFDKWDKLKQTLVNKHIFIFLDYDGTLTPITDCPQEAVISEKMRSLLKDLSLKPRCHLGVISGRALSDIKERVGLNNIIYAGNHGLEIEGPKIKFRSLVAVGTQTIIEDIKNKLLSRLSDIKGILVEDKSITLSVHYRLAARKDYLLSKKIIEEVLRPFLEGGKVNVSRGKKVTEIRPPVQWNKGRVADWLLAREIFILNEQEIVPIYLGDDLGDEDAFRALRGRGLTIYVGKPKESQARYYLKDTREVQRLLEEILHLP